MRMPPAPRVAISFGASRTSLHLSLRGFLDAQSVQFFNAQRGKVFVIAAARIAYPGDLTVFESKCDVQMVHVFIRMNKDFMRRKSLCECFENGHGRRPGSVEPNGMLRVFGRVLGIGSIPLRSPVFARPVVPCGDFETARVNCLVGVLDLLRHWHKRVEVPDFSVRTNSKISFGSPLITLSVLDTQFGIRFTSVLISRAVTAPSNA